MFEVLQSTYCWFEEDLNRLHCGHCCCQYHCFLTTKSMLSFPKSFPTPSPHTKDHQKPVVVLEFLIHQQRGNNKKIRRPTILDWKKKKEQVTCVLAASGIGGGGGNYSNTTTYSNVPRILHLDHHAPSYFHGQSSIVNFDVGSLSFQAQDPAVVLLPYNQYVLGSVIVMIK